MRTEARGVVAVAGEPTDRVPLNRMVVFACLVLAGVAWDLASKEYVFATLGLPGRSDWEWEVDGIVWFVLQTNLNYGALWGIGQGWTSVFAGLSLVAVVGVLYFLFVMKQARSWWLTVSLGFVLAGALGNLYDRLGLHGLIDPRTGEAAYAVRDFLYFRLFDTFDWAIFNFADTYLVTGAIMLIVHSLQSESAPAPEPTAISHTA